jgi:signal transduction histidine kinase
MRLANFIRSNIEPISVEWEKFAATLLPEEEFSKSILRDGIVNILKEIAASMGSSQNAVEQQGKSQGEQDNKAAKDNAAETHALARVHMGLSSRQLISEFRALRATVLRLWDESDQVFDKQDIYDITRFNEAIDQTLTEATGRYLDKIEQSRELFLGILGHDLRTPLGAIMGTAQLIVYSKIPDRHFEFANQILLAARRMSYMITDLIELTRVQLGAGISVNLTETDLQRICSQVLTEMKAAYPERVFEMDSEGHLVGKWDEARLSQVLSNLMGNAVQHGAVDSAIKMTVKKINDRVEIQVHNEGRAIPENLLPRLFDRFVQGKSGTRASESQSTSLGLGLYIAKEIIVAHGGTITVQSTDTEGTTFTACLPLVDGA